MIYQCYFHPSQRVRLFPHLPYRPFGLEPEVNPGLTHNCPELESPEHRLHLLEFAAMFHLWRNPPDDGHDWIGFSSRRQLDKCPTIFLPGEVEAGLRRGDVVAWWRLRFPVSVAAQAEGCHPGVLAFMEQMLRDLGAGDLAPYHASSVGIYASYWAVRKGDFEQYMRWFYPFIDYCLKHLQSHPYLRANPKASSYALERLFMLWCWQNGKRVVDYTGSQGDHPRCWADPEQSLAWQELDRRFQIERRNPGNDLHAHLDLLYRYAGGCDTVTEFGTRHGLSATAFLRALPRRLVCFDLERQPEVDQLAKWASLLGVEFQFRQEDTRTAVIELTDLLFVDTLHNYEQVRAELAGKEALVRRYIILHDTETFAEVGEQQGTVGIWPAVAAFLRRSPDWRLVHHSPDCWGLSVLARA